MRNLLAFVGLIHTCVVRLVIVCLLFSILTDTFADTHIVLPSTGAHSQNFVKLTLGFTPVTIPSLLWTNEGGVSVSKTTRVIAQRFSI